MQAGEVEAVHKVTTANVYRQQLVQVEGQTDILTLGIPYICPYNVNSVMNPILVMCTGLGYFFNLYRGKPLVREGGVVIMTHPTPWEFHPVHHPSYIDFFEQVLADTTDPVEIEEKYEKSFAEDEWYRHLYRTSYAYHGVHPFYMWYWGAHGMQHLRPGDHRRRDPKAVRRLGFTPASTGRRAGAGHRRRRAAPDDHPPAHPAAAPHRGELTWRRRPEGAERGGVVRSPAHHRQAVEGHAVARLPVARPECPGLQVPREPKKRGADFDTDWARRTPARVARAAIVEGPLRLAVKALADPEREGLDRLPDLLRRRTTTAIRRGDLRRQPPQPPRRTDDDHVGPESLAAQAGGRRSRRLLLLDGVTGTASALALGAFPIDRSR